MEKRVYLAGPDVFYPDAKEKGQALKDLCAKYNMIGVFPLDAGLDLSAAPSPEAQGVMIYDANLDFIDSCDAVLANMTPFRGPSMDIGTGFEMGYAEGKGKPIFAYTDDMSFYETRVPVDGLLIEQFNMIDNLMVHACPRGIYETAEEAVKALAIFFESTQRARPLTETELSALVPKGYRRGDPP